MKKTLRNYLRLLRPRQWIKNLAIFATITFTGQLFIPSIFIEIFGGFLIFCAISSAIYIINDYFDIEKDKLHPFKKFRPLASGELPVTNALLLSVVMVAGSLIASFLISPAFFGITVFYLVLQLSYSVLLKDIEIIDILALAGGYILRVYAGEVLGGYHISVWMLLTTISLSLFLAIGKRRSELTLVSQYTHSQIAATRKTLSHYSEKLLDVYASMFATSTFISYTLFAFFENTRDATVTNDWFLPEFLPQYLQRKWLMVTILPVVYGLMRYLQDIYERHEGESPEKVLINDKPLLINLFIWVFLVIVIIYVIGA